MSDDPFYPSPIVKSQKSTRPEHKVLTCAPLATIKVGHRRFQKQKSFFFHTTQLKHKDLCVPFPVLRTSVQKVRVHLAPSVIKHEYCKDLRVWWHEDVLRDMNTKFLSLGRRRANWDRRRSSFLLNGPDTGVTSEWLDLSCVCLLLFITLTELTIQRNKMILAARTNCKTKEGKYQFVVQK